MRDVESPAPGPARTSDVFLRHVAHDLRASLNVVVSWGELVKAAQLPPDDLARAGDTIVRHARQLSRRLTDALDLWRLDLGRLELTAHPSPVSAAVRSAVDLARPHFDSRRVECSVDIHADGLAQVDGARLVQALVVLLEDAATNTPAGQRVHVTLDVETTGPIVRIVGGGRMPDAAAFDRNPPETRQAVGSRPFDFGLALARGLVERNAGVLDVERAEGDRVAFVVRLSIPGPSVQRDEQG
jgi:K+-sensing histidine kinase KdpD